MSDSISLALLVPIFLLLRDGAIDACSQDLGAVDVYSSAVRPQVKQIKANYVYSLIIDH